MCGECGRYDVIGVELQVALDTLGPHKIQTQRLVGYTTVSNMLFAFFGGGVQSFISNAKRSHLRTTRILNGQEFLNLSRTFSPCVLRGSPCPWPQSRRTFWRRAVAKHGILKPFPNSLLPTTLSVPILMLVYATKNKETPVEQADHTAGGAIRRFGKAD